MEWTLIGIGARGEPEQRAASNCHNKFSLLTSLFRRTEQLPAMRTSFDLDPRSAFSVCLYPSTYLPVEGGGRRRYG